MNTKEIFDFFAGKWEVAREISYCEERSDEVIHNIYGLRCVKELLAMTIKGQASFTIPSPNIILYSEEVTLNNDLWHQKYQYKYDPKENKLHKYFANGDYFYELIIEKNIIKGFHKCLEDLYHSEYNFPTVNEIQIAYKIKGPKKNHEILSRYKRIC